MIADPFESELPPERIGNVMIPIEIQALGEMPGKKYCVQFWSDTGNDKPCVNCHIPMNFLQKRVCKQK